MSPEPLRVDPRLRGPRRGRPDPPGRIEHLASFRAIPQFEVVRPDPTMWETARGLSRVLREGEHLPDRHDPDPPGRADPRRDRQRRPRTAVKKGAYVLVDTEGTPDVIIMASGSEVQWAVAAAKTLADEGIKARGRLHGLDGMVRGAGRRITRSPCCRLPSRPASPSRPVWPCRGTSSLRRLRQARLESSSSVCRATARRT